MPAANTPALGASALAHEAVRQPLLKRHEELDLVRRADAGDGEALNRLIGSHLRYVIRIARSYRGWGLPMSDLIHEGILGLLQAIRRFNPDRGVRLSTYAGWWIRSAMQDSVLRSWSVVRLGTSNAQKMLALKLKVGLHGGAGAAGEEYIGRLARRFGTTMQEARRLAVRMVGSDASLDSTDSGRGLIERLATEVPTPEQIVARSRELRWLREVVGAAVERLTPREQLVIRKRYLDEVRATFEAIGRELGVSKDRARQLEARALGKLQRLLEPVLARADS